MWNGLQLCFKPHEHRPHSQLLLPLFPCVQQKEETFTRHWLKWQIELICTQQKIGIKPIFCQHNCLWPVFGIRLLLFLVMWPEKGRCHMTKQGLDFCREGFYVHWQFVRTEFCPLSLTIGSGISMERRLWCTKVDLTSSQLTPYWPSATDQHNTAKPVIVPLLRHDPFSYIGLDFSSKSSLSS